VRLAAITEVIVLCDVLASLAPVTPSARSSSALLFAQTACQEGQDPPKESKGLLSSGVSTAAHLVPGDTPEHRTGATIRQEPVLTLPIRVEVNMVLVNITVTDADDRIVTGLDQAHFEIYDDKVPQQIAAFSTEDAPISVGLIFDSSGSMSNKIEKSKQAALQFFKTSNPQDEFMLISFNERPYLVSSFTSKFENLQDRLILVKAGGMTALLDAIYLGIAEMKNATTNRKALIVISDGGDNHSRYTERDIRRAVKESDAEI